VIPAVSEIVPIDEDWTVVFGARLPWFLIETVGRPIFAGAVQHEPDFIAVLYVDPDKRAVAIANLRAERVMDDVLGARWVALLGWTDDLGDHELRFGIAGEPNFIPRVIPKGSKARWTVDPRVEKALTEATSTLLGRQVRLSHFEQEPPSPTVLEGMDAHHDLALMQLLPGDNLRYIGWASIDEPPVDRYFVRFRVVAKAARLPGVIRGKMKPPGHDA
jgi:hypothetical protein